jgi:dTDP-4-amino-4,6-dideoxygalactose transaminase
VAMYNAAFKDCDVLELPVSRTEVEHAWHLYVLRLNLEMLKLDRAEFIEQMAERNIGTTVHFIPIHLHPFYRDKYGYSPRDFPVGFSHYERMLSLPLSPRHGDQDIADTIEAVLDIVKQYRK